MATVEQVATRHADRQTTLARRTAAEMARLWRAVDVGNIDASWRAMLPRALTVLGTSQATAAASAGMYIGDALEASGVAGDAAYHVRPGAFAGVASDGRPLVTLLRQPTFAALRQIGRGADPARGLETGAVLLDMIVRTQVADAGRVAAGVAIAARPQATGYVRLVVGTTCSRCLILAGRRYRWNAGFRRHPRCDCRHVPVAEDVPGDVATDPRAHFGSLSRVEQDKLLGRAGAQAVREGADIAKVVNARRGMQTAVDGRLYTTEAAGRRPRLMPEQIYREVGTDRAEALRLLRLHGYLSPRI